MKYYAGIGSRDCPKEIASLMVKVAAWLSRRGYILRSGKAPGSDEAFEKGCDMVNGEKEIFLPWTGFNNSESNLVVKDKRAFDIAKKYHPYYDRLGQGAKKLQARNSHQILGKDLETPCDFVICYTEGGKEIGGTAQALRISKDYNIPVFNFGSYNNIDECRENFMKFIEDFI